MLAAPVTYCRFFFVRKSGLPFLCRFTFSVRLNLGCEVLRQRESLDACTSDRAVVSMNVVSISGHARRRHFSPAFLTRLHLAFSFLAHCSQAFFLCFFRTKQVRPNVHLEERLCDFLSARAEVDFSAVSAVLRLVGFRSVYPDAPGRFQVAAAHNAQFARPSARQ